jgi:hypothetical protein
MLSAYYEKVPGLAASSWLIALPWPRGVNLMFEVGMGSGSGSA